MLQDEGNLSDVIVGLELADLVGGDRVDGVDFEGVEFGEGGTVEDVDAFVLEDATAPPGLQRELR